MPAPRRRSTPIHRCSAIDGALAGLEAEALQKGSALAIAQGYPVSLDRLRRWAASLGDKGLVLAPVSAVLIEQSGLAAEARGDADAVAAPKASGGPPEGYRPCVGLMLIGPDRRLFLGERLGPLQEAWQMPQGGIDPGRKPARGRAARAPGGGRHRPRPSCWPKARSGMPTTCPPTDCRTHWAGRYRGQSQKWFAFRFTGTDADIDLTRHHAEFARWRWASADEVLRLIVPFKRPVYEAVLAVFAPLLR